MILLNDLRFIMQIGIVDPDCRIIGLHLYDGLFKVSPLSVTSVLMDLNHLSLVPSCTFAPPEILYVLIPFLELNLYLSGYTL
jgi:hypothetical protein